MMWATRSECHVDRAACAWLILRFIDRDATFCFTDEIEDVPAGARPFDMPGAELSHHGARCSFETMLQRFGLDEPALQDLGQIVHEADLGDERYDAPEAAGLDVIIRGLTLTLPDGQVLAASLPIGLYAYRKRANALGRIPS